MGKYSAREMAVLALATLGPIQKLEIRAEYFPVLPDYSECNKIYYITFSCREIIKPYQSVTILEFLRFCDVSRKHRNANFCIFQALFFCFLGFVHHHNELFFSYLWSFICKFTSSEEIQILADEERTPTSCSI